LLYTALGNVHRIKVDEKAGLLIATHVLGGLSVTHLFSCAVLWCLPHVRLPSTTHTARWLTNDSRRV
jgi:hypothetical protein